MSKPKDALGWIGGGCLGLYALLVFGALLTVIALIVSTGAAIERAKRQGELRRTAAAACDAVRAELYARSGIERLAVELRSGRAPGSPLRGVMGQSYMDGEDSYEVTFEQVAGDFAGESVGRVRREPRYGETEGELLSECTLEVRLDAGGRILSLVKTTAEPR